VKPYSTRAPARDSDDEHYRDRPLGFHWSVDRDVISSLNLGPAPNKQCRAALNSTLTEAVLAAQEGRRVSYSRNRNFYIGQQRYRGTAYTYRTVLWAVAEGCRAGLLTDWRQQPGTDRKWQSTFAATPALLEAWSYGRKLVTA
jgi:hypothetical protein